MNIHRRSALCLFAVAALAGCGGIGPKTVAQDRFDYTEAISSSWKQQMLVNIVKLRYGDTPVFLDVASVINQYSVEASTDVRFSWVHPQITTGDAQSVGGAAKYTDRPTITYMPITGERFARSLMKPLPPPAVLSLIEAGYPIDLVLRVTVNGINGVRNRYGGAARARAADPEFYAVLDRMRQLQGSGAIGLRVSKTNETEGMVMVFRGKVDPSLEDDSRFIRKTLGLDPDAQEFRIAYGSVAKDDKEIALLTRSILEILVDLGSYIQVPDADVQESRVNATMPAEVAAGKTVPPLIGIHSASSRPNDGFVAVPYRNHWFWIDDRDMRSKSLFTFLMFIFSLTETQGKEGGPIVTIPAG